MKTFATRPKGDPLEPRPCALCGSEGFARLWPLEGYAFVRCRRCGLVQQNPQPQLAAVLERYAGSEYLAYEASRQFDYRGLELKALADLDLEGATGELRARATRAGSLPSFLDVGCATGALLDAMRERGWAVAGVETSPEQAAYGRERFGLDIRASTLEASGFGRESFDVVHASQLIEHLNDPRSFLRAAKSLLKPGGFLVLATPNADGFQARLLGGRWRSAINDHLYLFSKRTLLALLASEGFGVLSTVTWGGWAVGLKPAFLKPRLDAWAKARGQGDVMAVLAQVKPGAQALPGKDGRDV